MMGKKKKKKIQEMGEGEQTRNPFVKHTVNYLITTVTKSSLTERNQNL